MGLTPNLIDSLLRLVVSRFATVEFRLFFVYVRRLTKIFVRSDYGLGSSFEQ